MPPVPLSKQAVQRGLELAAASGTPAHEMHDLDDELGYCVSCWCEIPNHGRLRYCDECEGDRAA